MVPVEENKLVTNPEIIVKQVTEWDPSFATEIFEKAGEPWEIGVARALMNALVEYCNEQKIENCYLWPAGESAQRIYQEAGFRTVAVMKAGRAVLEALC